MSSSAQAIARVRRAKVQSGASSTAAASRPRPSARVNDESTRMRPSRTIALSAQDVWPTARPGTSHYMLHCHNLEHEDSGLMLNFAVKA